MLEVRQQPIGYVDGTMGEADQLLSQGDPGRRGIQRRQTCFDLLGLKLYSPLRVSKGQSGIAQMARYPYVISRLRAARRRAFPSATSPMMVTQILRGPCVVSPPISST